MPANHRLIPDDLGELADGRPGPELLQRLRAAQSSKNKLLFEALRRRAADPDLDDLFRDIERAERLDPPAAHAPFSRPSAGVWAVHSLRLLTAGGRPDPAHFATLSAPNDAPVLRAQHGDARIQIALDGLDPFLDVYGCPVDVPQHAELALWRERFAACWRLLVTFHPRTAAAVQAGISTIVPLRSGPNGEVVSATFGSAFGAVGLSLPADPLAFAENLVHEFQHLVLVAIDDLAPLTDGAGRTRYAPWRDDPRPLPGRLHGCFAYLGICAFWRRHRRCGPEADRALADRRLARWVTPTLQTVRELRTDPALTDVGRVLGSAMEERLSAWADQLAGPGGVPADVLREADAAAASHRALHRDGARS
ncbi:aKG-HExxH-type peptide beta-hydroxylase [Actinomadura sp. 9N407]|uniref:aKG-HExxH-type peptide beta-hydroxylase n=1 Tax=Actinomadura sp. 9N407 TaxID=3375154 RepID=UPI00378DE63D